MAIINRADQRKSYGHGNFKIEITFPGINLHRDSDPGLSSLGRFDHAVLKPGAFIGMHKHQNDEILSLVKFGTLLHRDSTGQIVPISADRLMMMNAGSGIFHEESIPTNLYSEDVEMLQIFVRPESENQDPLVQFAEFTEISNRWRLIAGPAVFEAPMMIRNEIIVYDLSTKGGLNSFDLPKSPFLNTTSLLYVFSGSIKITEKDRLYEGDSLVVGNDDHIEIMTRGNVIVVLFQINTLAAYTRAGMFSGVM